MLTFLEHHKNVGKVFGRLLVLNVIKDKNGKGYIKYKCLCKCGVETCPTSSSVLTKATKSCGCYHIKQISGKKLIPSSLIRTGIKASVVTLIWHYYNRNAKKSGRGFFLTRRQFYNIIRKNCTYCGSAPAQLKKFKTKKSPSLLYNGIDRVDNNIGYTAKNSVPCCFICNKAKGTLSLKEFNIWRKRLSNFYRREK